MPRDRRPRGPIRRAFGWLFRGLLALLLLAVLTSLLSNIGVPTRSKSVERLAPVERNRMAEAQHLRRELGEAAWPGWGEPKIPILLYNEQYAFLLGYPAAPSGWETVPGEEFEGRPCYRKPHPDPQAFAVEVDGRWVASMATREWTAIELARLMRRDLPPVLEQVFPYRLMMRMFDSDWHIAAVSHESFHVYQMEVVPDRVEEAETHVGKFERAYPWDDPRMREAWQAEAAALAEAASAASDEEAAREARRFLDLRAQRRKTTGLSAELVAFERRREWLEGLAKYVELAIWKAGGDESARYEPLPVMARDPAFHHYSGFRRRWQSELSQLRKHAAREGEGRFYYTGMAQAFVLDRLSPGWKQRAFSPQDIWLEDLLAEAVRKT